MIRPLLPTRPFYHLNGAVKLQQALSSSAQRGYHHSTSSSARNIIKRQPRLIPTPTIRFASIRRFHPTPRRQDVFFIALPALKTVLLNVTRFSLLFLPFVIRYKIWKRYKRISLLLLQIPVFAVCVILAIGLDQCPRTGRWRLLLMGEHEELAWARRKHHEVLHKDGDRIVPPDDPRSLQVSRVITRLITALEEKDGHIVYGANWPPKFQELSRVMSDREELAERHGKTYAPSGTAKSTYLPFRPPSRNPLKRLEEADWRIYLIDSPELNAFALPSRDVFVYTGLLNTLPDDDTMLAAVLAHEIAHVVQRHSVENIGVLNLATVAFDVLRGVAFAFTISFPYITDSAGMFINYMNNVITERAYSRKLEMEADAVGLQIMATAGYDPRAAQDLWEFMMCVEQDAAASGRSASVEDRIALLRTHPTSETRRQALSADMDAALEVWREHRQKVSSGLTGQDVREKIPQSAQARSVLVSDS